MINRNIFVAALLTAFAAMPALALDRCIEVAVLPLATGHADTDDTLHDMLDAAAQGMVAAFVARHFDAVPVTLGRAAIESVPAAAAPGGMSCGWQALWSLSVTGQSPAFIVTYSAIVRHPTRGSQEAGNWVTDLRYEHVMRGLDEFLRAVPANFGRDAVVQLESSHTIPGLHGTGETTEDDIRVACERLERAASYDFLVRTMTFVKRSRATQAIQRLNSGESFEAVGEALLPQAAPSSFASIWGSPLEWDRAFTSAVVAAAPHGRVPAPVHTDKGWVVIEVDGRRSRLVPPCGGIEAEVRQSLSK